MSDSLSAKSEVETDKLAYAATERKSDWSAKAISVKIDASPYSGVSLRTIVAKKMSSPRTQVIG